VEFGQSIQAAVDAASPGDRITVQPGIYREPGRYCPTDTTKVCAVVVSKDDVSLIADARPGRPVILESMGSQQNGITFARPGSDTAQCLHDPSRHIRAPKSPASWCAISTQRNLHGLRRRLDDLIEHRERQQAVWNLSGSFERRLDQPQRRHRFPRHRDLRRTIPRRLRILDLEAGNVVVRPHLVDATSGLSDVDPGCRGNRWRRCG